MTDLKPYRRRQDTTVTAVQIDLETEGFTYEKWGDKQVAQAGDWLLNNNGNVYTVDAQVFEETYQEVSPGQYAKTSSVWARKAVADGQVQSTSGFTAYTAGDMIVFNTTDGTDGWAMDSQEFQRLYEPID